MKKLVLIGAVVLVAVYFGGVESGLVPRQESTVDAPAAADQALAAAYDNRQSNVQVQGSGRVTRILADDNEGSRHQRFIVRLASGQSILIAHNIDLASRIAPLAIGDVVEFYGEYEFNDKGGVIHWTHHDPQGRHVDGWIKHAGRTYR